MESQFMPKAERTRSTLAGSAAGDEPQFDEDIKDDPGSNPDSLLRDIERLNVSGANAEAGALLNVFLARYPDHPVSIKIRQQEF